MLLQCGVTCLLRIRGVTACLVCEKVKATSSAFEPAARAHKSMACAGFGVVGGFRRCGGLAHDLSRLYSSYDRQHVSPRHRTCRPQLDASLAPRLAYLAFCARFTLWRNHNGLGAENALAFFFLYCAGDRDFASGLVGMVRCALLDGRAIDRCFCSSVLFFALTAVRGDGPANRHGDSGGRLTRLHDLPDRLTYEIRR